MIRTFLLRSAALAALVYACCVGVPGCAHYQVGSHTLYRSDIETVYVPIFESDSFRRHLGEWLTEAVVKEIELRTPYKVVSEEAADTVLTGKILTDTKRVLGFSGTDEGRNLEFRLRVQVTWADRAGRTIYREASIPIPQALATSDQSSGFYPEIGQSMATAQQATIKKLAQHIVSLMECPW